MLDPHHLTMPFRVAFLLLVAMHLLLLVRHLLLEAMHLLLEAMHLLLVLKSLATCTSQAFTSSKKQGLPCDLLQADKQRCAESRHGLWSSKLLHRLLGL